MVLVAYTILYISLLCPCSVSRTYKSSLLSRLCFFIIVCQQEIVFLRIVLAHGFRVGTASGFIFSSWLASGKLTTPLQLHVGLQYPGGLAAGWNTLPRVTPLQWPTLGNSMWKNWGSNSLITLALALALDSTVCPCHFLPSVECNNARPCLGNKMISFLLIIYFRMK